MLQNGTCVRRPCMCYCTLFLFELPSVRENIASIFSDPNLPSTIYTDESWLFFVLLCFCTEYVLSSQRRIRTECIDNM